MLARSLQTKLKWQSLFYLKWAVVVFIVVIIFDKLIIENGPFRRGTFIMQDDLIDYNDDNLRNEWPLHLTKYYDVRDLRTYTSKPRIVPTVHTAELPGEGGLSKFRCNLFRLILFMV